MLSIESLNHVYPDARFVTTHRDVTKVIPSVASVETAVVHMMTGNADPRVHRQPLRRHLGPRLRRFIAFRDRVGEERFYDIAFDDLQTDPIGTIRGLYEWLGEEFTPGHRRCDGSCGGRPTKRSGSRPARTATARKTSGSTPTQLAERFAYYGERFPIAQPRGPR